MDENVYFKSTDGLKLMYRRWEPAQQTLKTPIVLLHGAASNSTRWWHFVENSRLAADRLLLRPDLRGNGESLWRGGPARLETWCQDIAEMLNHERKSCAIIVGHCLGANIAINFASRYPEMCAGLVLIEPISHNAARGILARLQLFLPLLQLIIVVIKQLNRIGIYRRHLKSVNLRILDRHVHEAGSEVSERERSLAKHGSPWHDLSVTPTTQYLENFIEIMRPLPVSSVRCQCLVIQSSGRRVTDPERTRAKLEALPTVKFIEIESQHWLPTTQPDHLCRKIDAWIMRH
jgi:pimeloyl-ACP methyl ester carboxylesterase